FSMFPRSHSSTLYPYTTLFRFMSPFVTGLVAAAVNQCTNTVAATEPVTNPAILIITPCVVVGYLLEHVGVPLAHNAAGDSVVRLDRKSTPLNSSHEKNSYAVFC